MTCCAAATMTAQGHFRQIDTLPTLSACPLRRGGTGRRARLSLGFLKTPIGWTRATGGQAATPPSSVMNSRRFMSDYVSARASGLAKRLRCCPIGAHQRKHVSSCFDIRPA